MINVRRMLGLLPNTLSISVATVTERATGNCLQPSQTRSRDPHRLLMSSERGREGLTAIESSDN